MKDELNIAPQVLQRRPLQLVYPPPGEGDGAALAVHQLQQRAPGGGLAAAGLAYQPQRLAGVKIETDVFHRVHPASNPIEQPAAQIKARDQMLHPQDRRGAWRHGILRRRILLAARQRKLRRQRPIGHRPQLRHRRQQRPGIGLLRRGKQLAHPILFHLFAAAHHQHPVGNLRHHAHVVSNEDHPHLHLPLQHADQLQDLRLNGDVEGGGGFIGNQQRRFAGERHGDHHRWRMPPESWCG